ncbi:MAG: glycosyltransferase family 4 protein [Bacteroidota bacterium]|nr:glycosyltransferase family 4 protein [Bacteroidota bacterium]
MNIETLIILTPGFAKDEKDTTCLPFLQNFVVELNEQFPSLKVSVLAFDYPFSKGAYRWNRNQIISFNGWRKRKFAKIVKWLIIYIRLKRIKRNNHVVGLLSLWCNECAFLGQRFAKSNKLPHFCWIMGQDAKMGNSYVSRTNPSATDLIAISDFIKDEFERNYKIRPAYIIPVGIRTAEFPGWNVERDIDVLGAGSLIPLKQYDIFINVIREVVQGFPAVRVLLCGKGAEENKLKKLVAEYGLEKNITFTGELPHLEILHLLSRTKIFLHTSNFEGLPAVCLEALYSGCHTVSCLQWIDYKIENWHIANTKEELVSYVWSVLNDRVAVHIPVLAFSIKETAQNIMRLYSYSESRIC